MVYLKCYIELKNGILLSLDNSTVLELNVPIKQINLVSLPTIKTFLIQFCDQEIIRTVRIYFRHEMQAECLEKLEINKTSVTPSPPSPPTEKKS